VTPASPDSRFAAALVDGLLLLLPVAAMFYLLAAVGLPTRPTAGLDALDDPELFLTPEELDALADSREAEWIALARVAGATAVFGLACTAAYLVVGHRRHGRTAGKQLLGLRLQRRDGGAPGLGAILVRGALGLARAGAWAVVAASGVALLLTRLGVDAPAVDDALNAFLEDRLGVDPQSPWIAVVLGTSILLFGAFELVQAGRRRSAADALTGTIVVREGYGSG